LMSLRGLEMRIGFSDSEPEPAALTPRCPRSFLPLALLASSG
jgi:hypothetical protein